MVPSHTLRNISSAITLWNPLDRSIEANLGSPDGTGKPRAHLAVLLLGDSNDRYLADAAATAFGLHAVEPAPLHSICTDLVLSREPQPGTAAARLVKRRGEPCPLYAGPNLTRPDLVVGMASIGGTVLHADTAGWLGSSNELANNRIATHNVNTTKPTLDALDAFTQWVGRPPDLVVLHSALRDIYRMCRFEALGETEAVAADALARRPSLTQAEADQYLRNFGALVRHVENHLARNPTHATATLSSLPSHSSLANRLRGKTVVAMRTLPLVRYSGLVNPCLANGTVVNRLLDDFNRLTREAARSLKLPCFDWADWLRGADPSQYMREPINGPHVIQPLLARWFGDMVLQGRVAASNSHCRP